MKKTKCPLKYIDRSLLFSPYYTLCFSEKKFDKEMKRLGVENPPPFVFPDSSASIAQDTVTDYFAEHGE